MSAPRLIKDTFLCRKRSQTVIGLEFVILKGHKALLEKPPDIYFTEPCKDSISGAPESYLLIYLGTLKH